MKDSIIIAYDTISIKTKVMDVGDVTSKKHKYSIVLHYSEWTCCFFLIWVSITCGTLPSKASEKITFRTIKA